MEHTPTSRVAVRAKCCAKKCILNVLLTLVGILRFMASAYLTIILQGAWTLRKYVF